MIGQKMQKENRVAVLVVLQEIVEEETRHGGSSPSFLHCRSKECGNQDHLVSHFTLFHALHLPFAHHVHDLESLRAQGFKGSYRVVHRFLETLPEYVKQRVGNVELSKAIPKHPLHDFQSQKAVW